MVAGEERAEHPSQSRSGDSPQGNEKHSTQDSLEDGSPDEHIGETIDEQLPDSAEEYQEDYPQFASDFEAPAQEQVDASGDLRLPPPPFPPEPPRSPGSAKLTAAHRTPPPPFPPERERERQSTSLRTLLPTNSAKLTAAHRAELLRHAAFFQERRQQLLDDLARERQAVSLLVPDRKLTRADAEEMIDNYHAKISQVILDELDIKVGRALSHASSLFTRIEILPTASNGGSSEPALPANRPPRDPSTPLPLPSPPRTDGLPSRMQREEPATSRNDMPPIERRPTTGLRGSCPPAPPFISPAQEDRWRASAGGASRAQSDSAVERRRSDSRSRSRSRSRSGVRLPPPPPLPAGGQGEGEGPSRNFTAEVVERVLNGNRCWQAEILQPKTDRHGERVYAVRAPQRRSREEAEVDGQKLTDASVEGAKAVRLVANDLARKK